MDIPIQLLPGDMVEVRNTVDHYAATGKYFNTSWKKFLEKHHHLFTVHRVHEDEFETSLYTAKKGHFRIKIEEVKRLVHRPMSTLDTHAWLSKLP